MVPPRVVISEAVRPLVEQIAFAARQIEYLAEVDREKILGNRQSTSEVQAPMPSIRQDAPTQSAVRYIVDASQVTEHLRRRHTVLALLCDVDTIERPVPALRLDHADAMLETLPGGQRHRVLFRFRIRK